jgi:hypothetical protein
MEAPGEATGIRGYSLLRLPYYLFGPFQHVNSVKGWTLLDSEGYSQRHLSTTHAAYHANKHGPASLNNPAVNPAHGYAANARVRSAKSVRSRSITVRSSDCGGWRQGRRGGTAGDWHLTQCLWVQSAEKEGNDGEVCWASRNRHARLFMPYDCGPVQHRGMCHPRRPLRIHG